MTATLSALLLLATASFAADEPVFSGPQPGERLEPFRATGVFDAIAGKPVDPVTAAKGAPLLLVFVHEANRPSIALTRLLLDYAATREADGLKHALVWLAADPTGTEADLKRMRHALPSKTTLAISADGQEGPGTYGLNRGVTLTILVGRHDRVTANFALVQPSVQADLPKILKAVTDVVGGEPPALADLPGGAAMAQPYAMAADRLRGLLRPVIQKDASREAVARAADAIDRLAAEDPAVRRELIRVARTVVDSGKLANYGTPYAQERLRTWAALAPEAEAKDKPQEPSPAQKDAADSKSP